MKLSKFEKVLRKNFPRNRYKKLRAELRQQVRTTGQINVDDFHLRFVQRAGIKELKKVLKENPPTMRKLKWVTWNRFEDENGCTVKEDFIGSVWSEKERDFIPVIFDAN